MRKKKFLEFMSKNIFFIFLMLFIFIMTSLVIELGINTSKLNFLIYLPQILLVMLTMLYVVETKKIADKTAESIETTKDYIKVISDIEKEKLTYNLIKEWYYDKKLLTTLK